MDVPTLFKKIFSEPERFLKPFDNYLDKNAKHPNLACTDEDKLKFPFKTDAFQKRYTESLCTCDSVRPDIAKSVFDCLKDVEYDEYLISVMCKDRMNALDQIIKDTNATLKRDIDVFDKIWKGCKKEVDEVKAGDPVSIAPLHACFMPKFCSTKVNAALNCANKNNQELDACEKQVEDLLKCSIDVFHQHYYKTRNFVDKP